MIIEFENTKSKGDVIRSMNETFSTQKENGDGEGKDGEGEGKPRVSELLEE